MDADAVAAPLRGPEHIASIDDFIAELNNLRRRAAFGTGKARASIDDIARATRIPRSSVHVYISGRILPPGDALSAIVQALGADRPEVIAWLSALERLELDPARPSPDARPARKPDGPVIPRQLPPLPGLFPDALAPIVRTGADGVRELVTARWGMPSPAFALKGRHAPLKSIRRLAM